MGTARTVSCPYLRLDASGALLDPRDAPTDDHRCVAIGGPRIVSRQQQELMCLQAAHADCPRYRRGIVLTPGERAGFRVPRLPPATTAALIVLAISAAVSFGFVIQRGGIDLPSNAPGPSLVAAVGSAPAASATASPGPATVAPSPAPSSAPSSAPSADASASVAPSAGPSASPIATVAPTATRKPSAKPTATAIPSGGVPSPDRLAVIKPCPGQPGCWIYNVRAGDNLWSIAHWFGVPLDTIYAWNPTVKQTGIHAGMPLKIPTPTR